MHGNPEIVSALLQGWTSWEASTYVTIGIFPPAVFLDAVKWGLRHSAVKWGAQDVSCYAGQGAYTGEISAEMLKTLGCRYVLVGHSERRHVLGESDALVAEKYQRVLECGMIPVLCVGETSAQHAPFVTEKTVLAQLQSVLNLALPVSHLEKMVIAYEPVWAIGTGHAATPSEAKHVHRVLREALISHAASLAAVPIVYGGSVSADNAHDFLALPEVDGVLVGGASLKAGAFRGIVHAAEKAAIPAVTTTLSSDNPEWE
jgi:triosephosphate isomerase